MPVGRIVDEPDPVTRRILDINVYGVILGSKLAAQRMVPRGRGHVINVASLAGEIYAVGVATYCASKHAVVAFTDSARLEYRSAGVKFSMVLPSFVNTELIAGTGGIKGFKNAEPADIADAIVGLIVHPKPRVRVTKAAGSMIVAQRFMPRQVSEGLTDSSAASMSSPTMSTWRSAGPTRLGLAARSDRCAAPAGVDQRASELPCAGGACVVGQPGSCSGEP